MKLLTTLLLITATLTTCVYAQTIRYDSVIVIRKAKRDAIRLRLKNSDLKAFNAAPFPTSSDYFKPTARTVSDTSFLHDSLYVATFRTAAFYNAVNQRQMPSPADLLLPHPPPRNLRPEYPAGNQRTARYDAEKFNLPYDLLKRFKTEMWPNTTDYFKPNAKTTADTALLMDSVYVKTFRTEAFYKANNTRLHPGGHAELIGGIVVVGVAFVTLVIIAFSHLRFD